jgi:hypothetical protein
MRWAGIYRAFSLVASNYSSELDRGITLVKAKRTNERTNINYMNTTLKQTKRRTGHVLTNFAQRPSDEMLRWYQEACRQAGPVGTFEEESRDCITLDEFSQLWEEAINRQFPN